MMRRLEAILRRRSCEMIRGTRARELLIADRRCTGVIADGAERGTMFEARAVVLADGGAVEMGGGPSVRLLMLVPLASPD